MESTNIKLNNKKQITVILVGGTINMVGLEEGRVPGKGVLEILDEISYRFEDLTIKVKNIFKRPPDSSNLGSEDWNLINKTIKETLKENNDGIVVAHGTDTLQLTSFSTALELMNETLSCPVIYTASFAPLDDVNSDAKSNILKAIYLTRESIKPNIYVVIGDDLHLASRVSKVYSLPNSSGRYFYSYPKPIGEVKLEKDFSYTFDEKYFDTLNLTKQCFNVNTNQKWGTVEHLIIDQYTSLLVFEALILRVNSYLKKEKRRYCGLILQGDISCNSNFSLILNKLLKLSDKTIIMLNSKDSYKILSKSLVNLGFIPNSIAVENARMKLSYLLNSDKSKKDILGLMLKNFVGEIYNSDDIPKWLDSDTYELSDENMVIMVYPDISNKVFKDQISIAKKLNLNVIMYGFGDGHIPTKNKSIMEILNIHLYRTFGNMLDKKSNLTKINGEIIPALCMYISNNSEKTIEYLNRRFNINVSNEKLEIKKVQIANFILREAIIKSDLKFKYISDAIDCGVNVYIKSQVAKAKTNTLLYENGQKSLIIGVIAELNKQEFTFNYCMKKI